MRKVMHHDRWDVNSASSGGGGRGVRWTGERETSKQERGDAGTCIRPEVIKLDRCRSDLLSPSASSKNGSYIRCHKSAFIEMHRCRGSHSEHKPIAARPLSVEIRVANDGGEQGP